MKNKNTVSIILAVLAVCLSAASLVICLVMKTPEKKTDTEPAQTAETTAETTTAANEDLQYILYLGTNDKDTNEPVYPPEESKRKLEDILLESMGGYTIQEASGGWIGDDGTEYQEYTLVIHLSDTTIDKVHALCDPLIKVYDQSSILIQLNKTSTEFYSGS